MINITSTMSQAEILKVAHSEVAIPSMIVLFIFFSILFLVSGLCLIDYKRSDPSKFILIWFVGTIVSLIALVIFCMNPGLALNITNFFTGVAK